MAVLGLDAGSTFIKAVLFDGEIAETCIVPALFDSPAAIAQVKQHFAGRYKHLVATGYGRDLAGGDRKITEITCHAKGSAYLFEGVRTVIDIGGQDSKVICLNDRGGVSDFVMNDKCAAGTGRFVDSILKAMNETFEEIDSITGNAQPCQINSMCTVFAETEVISLLSAGTPKADIILGIIHSICKRIVNQQLNKLNYEEKIAFTGGLFRSRVIRDTLSRYAGTEIMTSAFSQYAGALGAALIGFESKNQV